MAETVAHVVGARPNFMKAAPVMRALNARGVEQRLIHTGQHYDDQLSAVFFRDLGLPEPDLNLGVGSGSHATQTAALLVALERAFAEIEPALVVVYGDVNSSLAASLVAAKVGLPIAHVEAGLRSFDDSMPEEINRRVTDLLSDILFVTSPEGLTNLERVGVGADRMHLVGNPMIDTLLANLDRFDSAAMRRGLGLPERYAVATLHRPSNVDDPRRAAQVVAMLEGIAELVPLVVPLHPRGRRVLEAAGLPAAGASGPLRIVEPMGYIDFLSLVRGAALVVTDSGGIQEETTILGVPCLTLRPNTERPITISHGTNRLVEPEDVLPATRAILRDGLVAPSEGPPLWDGHAGDRIAAIVEGWLAGRVVAGAGRRDQARVEPPASMTASAAPSRPSPT
jgi:UDP-N-acetylglucosamine 2-epimerase (non-hydrolysing)